VTRYATPLEDQPTRAEVDAAEAAVAAGWSVVDGMVQCQHGCTSWFHAHDTEAALRHYRRHEAGAL
jgi:uncharacterized protein YbdZ (MbtH family)